MFQLLSDSDTHTRNVKPKGEKKNRDNIDHMIRLLQENCEDVPKFAAVDIRPLPPIAFDSVDVSVLLVSTKKVENDMTIMKDCMKTVHKTTCLLKDTTST